MKKLSLLFLTIVLALTLSACGRKMDGYYISYSLHYDTMNYLQSSSASDSDLYANFVDGLVENDNYGAIIPALASDWSDVINDEGKHVWTFDIRQGVKWVDSEGVEKGDVVADDWVAAAEYILNPESLSETSWLMFMFIEGAQDYYVSRQDDDASNDLPISSVGVKALDTYTLEYTLAKPAPYFDTALTYSVFFPVKRSYLQEMGTDFGKDGKSILYNGGYIMTDDVKNTRVVMEKNENYWDADNVKINKVVWIYIPDDAGADWARLRFENNELTGIRLSEQDEKGWNKYVVGKNGKGDGTRENPADPRVYVAEATSKYTYYMLWNFDRAYDAADLGTEKTEAQATATNKALLNTDFRLGFLHGIDRTQFFSYYFEDNPEQWLRNTYNPRGLAQDQNGVDYVDYFAKEYATREGISETAAKEKLADGNDANFDVTKATTHFQEAKTALLDAGLTEADFPIIIETPIGPESQITPYYLQIANEFNKLFGENGTKGVFAQWNFVIANSGDEWDEIANTNYSYDLRFQMGWGPDYGDPLTYLNTYVVGGDMIEYSGLDPEDDALQQTILGGYTNLVETADAIWEPDRIDERFELMAKAEYKLMYEDAIIIPLYAPNGSDVWLSKSKPFLASKSMYGISNAKFKFMEILDKPITREERDELEAEYNANNPANN